MPCLDNTVGSRNISSRHARAALVAVVTLLTIGQQYVFANTFNVNSTADILNPPAGTVTLRSAIQAANSTPGGNIINLTLPGTYKITIPGANTGTNASGAFAILSGGFTVSATVLRDQTWNRFWNRLSP